MFSDLTYKTKSPIYNYSESVLEDEMVKIIPCEHGKKAVVRAGKVLTAHGLELDQTYGSHDYTPRQAFRIAHDWRESHNYPQWRIRMELGNIAKKLTRRLPVPPV